MVAWSNIVQVLGIRHGLQARDYALTDDYSLATFFDNFDFFSSHDPTNGFVRYQTGEAATSAGLILTKPDAAEVHVDARDVAPAGRGGVRLESKRSYDSGLVIIDVKHMPGGICGVWPALWMLGPEWPTNGEIDIVEGVNDQSTNRMTLHTNDGCAIATPSPANMTDTVLTKNCNVFAPDQPSNQGCAIQSQSANTYGPAFNINGGGTWAVEVTNQAVSVHFFPAGSVPQDILAGLPKPETWGMPTARFGGNCNIANHFRKLKIVINTTFCGDWAGSAWASSPTCLAKASSCVDYVRNHPLDFQEAYWAIRSLRIFNRPLGVKLF